MPNTHYSPHPLLGRSFGTRLMFRPEEFADDLSYVKAELCFLFPAIYAFFWLLYTGFFWFWLDHPLGAGLCFGLGFLSAVSGVWRVWGFRDAYGGALLASVGGVMALLGLMAITEVVYSPMLGWIFFGSVTLGLLLGGKESLWVLTLAWATIAGMEFTYIRQEWPSALLRYDVKSSQFQTFMFLTHICSTLALGLVTFLFDQVLRISMQSTTAARKEALENHRQIEDLFANLPSATLTILPDLSIGSEKSQLFSSLFPDALEGQAVLDKVFRPSFMSEAEYQDLETQLRAIFSRTLAQESKISHLLPKEFCREYQDSIQTLKLTWSPLHNSSHLIQKLILSMEDISTELKAKEIAQLAEQSSILLGETIAGVAHDLANPSQMIVDENWAFKKHLEQFSQQLLSLFAEVDDPDGLELKASFENMLKDFKNHQQKIELGIRRIMEIQGAIRNQSRIDKISHDERLLYIVQESTVILHSKLKEFALRIDIPESLTLHCFRSQIGQVFTNLISNAADAIHEENLPRAAGRPLIIIRYIPLETYGDFRIEVEDDGPGIPDTFRQRLFREKLTNKPTGKGTGLGLILSAKILSHHGAQLRLGTSRELKGACFVIEWSDSKAAQITRSASA